MAYGKIIEAELYGIAPYHENVEKLMRMKPKLPVAMDVIRTSFEGDPSDPEKEFANDLHASIADKLGLEDYGKLRFYTTVETFVDFKGVDGFFDLEDEDGNVHTVTTDLTINTDKADGWKADIIILIPSDGLDPKFERKVYMEKVNEIAETITKEFQFKIKNFGRKSNEK